MKVSADIELYVPWPPTVNSYYSHTKRGVFISKKGRQYRDEVLSEIQQQTPNMQLDESIHLTVILYPPDRRRRDLDNYMKALLDACTEAGLWEDDSLIDQLYILRGSVVRQGAVKLILAGGAPIIPHEAGGITF